MCNKALEQVTDQDLLVQLLQNISVCAAIGADALHECGGPAQLTQWLTEAATGFAQASVSEAVLDQVQLSPEWRDAIRRTLRGT